jgi:hypothetical protein
MAAATRITITGTLTDPGGDPVAGPLPLAVSPLLLHGATGDAVDPGTPGAIAGPDGAITCQVTATDDPAFSPAGWTWRVSMVVGAIRQTFRCAIPYNASGGELQLAQLVPEPDPGDAALYATLAALNELAGDVDTNTAAIAGLIDDDQMAAAIAAALVAYTPRTLVDGVFKIMKANGSAVVQFRATGGAVDIDVTGQPVWSAWDDADFDSGQFGLLRMRGNGLTLGGVTEFGAAGNVYGNDSSIDPGVRATLGGAGDLVPGGFVGVKLTAGAPTTGTHQLRDWCIDSAGAVHLCTAAGTPGTWT